MASFVPSQEARTQHKDTLENPPKKKQKKTYLQIDSQIPRSESV